VSEWRQRPRQRLRLRPRIKIGIEIEFAIITFNAPHYPLYAKPKDIAKYRSKFMMGWDVMRKRRYQRQIEMGLIDPERYPLSDTDSDSYDWETADQDFEDHRMAVYAAMVDCVDQNIGRLLQTLKDLKVAIANPIKADLQPAANSSAPPWGAAPG